jgi:protein TonB
VRENLRQVFSAVPLFPTSANGAPIHELRMSRNGAASRAQGASLLVHAAIISALAVLATYRAGSQADSMPPVEKIRTHVSVPRSLLDTLRGFNPSAGSGSGSGHDILPPTQDNLPPRSSIQLLKPTLPQNQHPELPVPPTILDAEASRTLTATDGIGLPWMKDRNNSSGPGKGNTIGDGTGDSIGSSPGDDAGWGGTPGGYRAGITSPMCAYCPDPEYTEEARKAKVQGTVTVRVLVGADGRASQIRMVSGIGLGLDERAMEAIRHWKFIPAKDAAKRPVATWVTVETVFRLF